MTQAIDHETKILVELLKVVIPNFSKEGFPTELAFGNANS